MVSPDFKKYRRLVRWPELGMVRERGGHSRWHVDEAPLSCLSNSRISIISGDRNIFRVWIPKSLETKKLHMLDPRGNEIPSVEICEDCAARIMKLLRWRSSDEGSLETEMQELRDETEERELRAKGLEE